MKPALAPAAVVSAIHAGPLDFTPLEAAVLVLCLAVALLSALRLWRIALRERRHPRLAALRGGRADAPSAPAPLKRWYGWLGAVVAASPLIGRNEQQRLLDVLAGAGFRRQGSLATLVAAKLSGAVALVVLVWLGLAWSQWISEWMLVRLALLAAALLLGWRLPDFALSRFAARRRLFIDQGMPDALDLLVVCAEAGLSLDQSIEQVSRDLKASHREVAEEFAITAAEMRVLPDRAAALENLVKRTHLETLRSITATLGQSIRFGTPLAESLRILAAEMRNARLMRIEERAARLPVLLTIPLVAFILPALFIVIGTPVVLRIYDFFTHFHIAGRVL